MNALRWPTLSTEIRTLTRERQPGPRTTANPPYDQGVTVATTSSEGSWASSESVRRSMQANRRCDTGPERRLRSLLHARGYRFRKDHRVDLDRVRVHIDIAFTRAKVATFVDGCFWHRCREHGSDP